MKVSKSTIVRTIVLIIAVINAGLVFFGKNTIDISEDAIYEIVSYAFLIGSSVVAWWKNNSFTQEALMGDQLKNEMKALKNNAGADNESSSTEEEHIKAEPEDAEVK